MKKLIVEEEREDTGSESGGDGGEERSESQQPQLSELFQSKQETKPTKKGRQGKKGKHGVQKPSAEQDDVVAAFVNDSDLPEVVKMTEGRQKAQKLRKEERESGRRIAAETKRKRHERAANKTRNEQEDETIPHMVDVERIQELITEEQDQAQQQPSAGGLLDDTIVQFISEREKAGLDERELNPTLRKGEQEKPRKSRKKEVHGRLHLILLDRNPPVNQTAVEFKNNHLFGNRLKRDVSMLQNVSKLSGL